jgi:hypothetical protein
LPGFTFFGVHAGGIISVPRRIAQNEDPFSRRQGSPLGKVVVCCRPI